MHGAPFQSVYEIYLKLAKANPGGAVLEPPISYPVNVSKGIGDRSLENYPLGTRNAFAQTNPVTLTVCLRQGGGPYIPSCDKPGPSADEG